MVEARAHKYILLYKLTVHSCIFYFSYFILFHTNHYYLCEYSAYLRYNYCVCHWKCRDCRAKSVKNQCTSHFHSHRLKKSKKKTFSFFARKGLYKCVLSIRVEVFILFANNSTVEFDSMKNRYNQNSTKVSTFQTTEFIWPVLTNKIIKANQK